MRLFLLLLALSTTGVFAQQTAQDLTTPNTAMAETSDSGIDGWLDRVTATQKEQPHWVTPVITVTPRLEQEFRFDVNRQIQTSGRHQWGLGGGKGLELIPSRRIEIIIGEPNYVVHNNLTVKDGFADETFLLKYRIASSNEEGGNYIVTAFMGASIPTASYKNGLTDASITPTIAFGKGCRNFSLQSTLGIQLPVANSVVIGKTQTWNTALQYHIKSAKLWPEVEFNENHFIDGLNAGRTQNFITPGLVIGRVPIHNRIAFTFGAGFQIATTQFHTFNHNAVLTFRLPF